MRTLLLTTSIVMAGAAAPALAQAPSGDAAGFCTAVYDPAGDDQAARPTSEFAEMDTDGDGMVSQAEYIECRNAAAGTKSVETDRSAENMAEADTDADELLTREEFLAAAAQAHGAVAASSDPGPDMVTVLRRYIFVPVSQPDIGEDAMSEAEVSMRSSQQFDALDTDSDDLISKEEWQETVATIQDRTEELIEGFGDLDRDSSGDLTEEEYAAGRAPRPAGGEASGSS